MLGTWDNNFIFDVLKTLKVALRSRHIELSLSYRTGNKIRNKVNQIFTLVGKSLPVVTSSCRSYHVKSTCKAHASRLLTFMYHL
jgi:hypothetical protein